MPHDLLHHVGGDRESDALRIVDDGGIDADYFAFDVEQRAAAVAGIDRGIGLDEGFVPGQPDGVALQAAHDTQRHGPVKRKRIADGHDPLADADFRGVTEWNRGKLTGWGDLHDGDVGVGIAADHLADEFRFVGQPDFHFLRITDHMIVGDNQTLFVHDHAGAGPRVVRAAITGGLA